MSATTIEPLLTIEDLARLLGVPVPTIYAWRYRGEGPRGYKVGRHVRFRLAEVNAWLEGRADVAKVA
ncbi:helix-turn-helix transcriptional regulator [Luteococcus sp.]|uniref:helix-turn-helix transcriptional regulator n=1 Tax=Luteococcus sp. TaxID=1969402 RepID=UPI003734ED4E